MTTAWVRSPGRSGRLRKLRKLKAAPHGAANIILRCQRAGSGLDHEEANDSYEPVRFTHLVQNAQGAHIDAAQRFVDFLPEVLGIQSEQRVNPMHSRRNLRVVGTAEPQIS